MIVKRNQYFRFMHSKDQVNFNLIGKTSVMSVKLMHNYKYLNQSQYL